MKELKIHLTFTSSILGTASANKELHSEFIASKAPDAPKREEEIAAIGADAYEEKGMTVFHRNKDGNPILFDYQIKGFFKDACSMLQKCRNGKQGKPEEFAKASCDLKAYKKIIDGVIFIKEREIPINVNGEIGNLQRPLRGQTAQGERIALANSELIPEGSTIDFTIIAMSDCYIPAIIEWLNYGRFRGIGQWRNGGFGRYKYEIVGD